MKKSVNENENEKIFDCCAHCSGRVLVCLYTDGSELADRDDHGVLHVCRGLADAVRFANNCGAYMAFMALRGKMIGIKDIVCVDKDDLIANGGFASVV